MAVIAGDLVTRLGVDGRRFQSGLDKARGQTRSFAADVTAIVSGIAIADIGKRAIGGIIDLTTSVVNLAASAQTAQITFEVLTGDAAKGAKLFKDIEKFAARTSFDLMSAADATKALLAAGVADTDVMNTMQLLGDLAMGDAEKLGFLSKAYTDVMNKGKLQGQELRQFAENGVGLVGALATSMGKTNAQILKMSEDGLISFDDMKNALQGLTGEGGRFHNMMARINETFTGQWNSLVENVQTFGRAIGAEVLPKLTKMVAEANSILTKFNELPDKVKFVGDVIDASMDVAFLSIKDKWKSMLKDMVADAVKIDWLSLINPVTGNAKNAMNAFNQQNAGDGNLAKAENRLKALLNQIKPNPGAANAGAAGFEWQGPREQGFAAALLRNMKPKPGELGTAFSKLFSAIGNDPLLAAGKSGLGGMMDRAKIQADAFGGMLSNWFGSPDWDKERKDTAKKQEPQLAGAMAAGSQEAFSTIFAAMLQRGKDPNVAATEKQTKELRRAMRENRPQNAILMGIAGL